MAHIGIISDPSPSHITTLATLGRELQKRGHRVTLFGFINIASRVQVQGLEFWSIGDSPYPPTNSTPRPGVEKDDCWATNLICLNAPTALREAGVEILLVDQLEPGGGTVADFLAIPFITVCCAQAINRQISIPPANIPALWKYETNWWAYLRNWIGYYLIDLIGIRPVNAVLNKYRQQWNLPILHCAEDSFSRLAQISQLTAEFDFPRTRLPKCFHYTGPFRTSSPEAGIFPYEQLTGQPLIYASFGTRITMDIKEKIFYYIAEACQDIDCQLVITYGSQVSESTNQRFPGSPLVVSYAPQLELLARAKLTITHAGLNTVLESLSKGVPLVAIPFGGGDWFGNAARIIWTGTGEIVRLKRLSVPRLRAAIQQVLIEPSYTQNAAKLQASILQSGGAVRAADIVEQVIFTGKPVLANQAT
ncbi:MAG: glycosyl transferase family 1 [Chroococcidiopsidaceae cyanobacterium CP_BM_RX_35]|nr:glycosyl transferase family 1 [Chroococcidiopsidaceae cyanobacterium CP_BM_RX_35]